ncbi:MAG: hypothetical protein N2035_09730 [Chthoniobacterales bacterium]|nr:hypothetical protein [Chthoniobacterales bacterium]
MIVFFLMSGVVFAEGSVEADWHWREIEKMESGPREKARTVEEARIKTEQHLRKHLELLNVFLRKFPKDERSIRAELRAAQIRASLGTLTGNLSLLREAEEMARAVELREVLDEGVRSEAAFTRASIVFLRARSEGGAAISEAIGVAQNFHVRFGGDRRAARLLVEAAEVCRGDLRLRRSLLEAAEKSARDEATRARAKDELRQLGWLGKEVSLRFPLASGGEWDLKDWRGKIVLLVFFSVDSPQSLIWLKRFGSEVGVLQKMGVGVFFVQLGGKKTGTEGLLRSMGLVQPVVYVQEGWESPEVRKLGINAVPTVWLLDEWGRLRSFDARENTVGLVREMKQGGGKRFEGMGL